MTDAKLRLLRAFSDYAAKQLRAKGYRTVSAVRLSSLIGYSDRELSELSDDEEYLSSLEESLLEEADDADEIVFFPFFFLKDSLTEHLMARHPGKCRSICTLLGISTEDFKKVLASIEASRQKKEPERKKDSQRPQVRMIGGRR